MSCTKPCTKVWLSRKIKLHLLVLSEFHNIMKWIVKFILHFPLLYVLAKFALQSDKRKLLRKNLDVKRRKGDFLRLDNTSLYFPRVSDSADSYRANPWKNIIPKELHFSSLIATLYQEAVVCSVFQDCKITFLRLFLQTCSKVSVTRGNFLLGHSSSQQRLDQRFFILGIEGQVFH